MDVLEDETTSPDSMLATAAPPAAPTKRAGAGIGRLLLVGLIAFLLATFTGRVDLTAALASVRDSAARVPAVTGPQAVTAADAATVAAIKDVITRANAAQVAAFAKNDATLMRATATDSYYQELARINRDLASAGVNAIELTQIDWGDVTVSGSTAHATTFETWRSTYDDGSVDTKTDRNEYSLVQGGGAWKIDGDVQPDSQVIDPGTGSSPGTTPSTPASTSSQSSNWSGYVTSGGTFTSVTGSWIVPTVSGATAGADATWVGIGGLNSRDLIQAGTQGTVSGGSVTYEAWIEMLPQSSRVIALSVSAGDAVTVTISQKSGNDWSIAMRNDSTGETYNTTVQYASSNSSAEWVQEAPSAGRGLVPLDDFGTLSFTAGSAVRDGRSMNLAALGARPIAMINGQGQVLAQPSTLAPDGSSFTVTRTSAPNTTTPGGRRRGRP